MSEPGNDQEMDIAPRANESGEPRRPKGPKLRKKKTRRKKKKKSNKSEGTEPDQSKPQTEDAVAPSAGLPPKRAKKKSTAGRWPFNKGRPKHPALDTHFKVLTTEAARTHHEQLRRALWEYREITSLLASNGHGQLIGLVTTMLVDKLKDAIDTARETAEQMDRAINKMMEAYGDEVEFSTRGLGEPHICTIVSSGPLSTQMMVYVREMDKAIVRLKLAYSAGLVNYDRRRDGVIELIGMSRNVLLGARAMKKIIRGAVSSGVEDHEKWEALLEHQRAKLGLAPAGDETAAGTNAPDENAAPGATKAANPGRQSAGSPKAGAGKAEKKGQPADKPEPRTADQEPPTVDQEPAKTSVGGILRDLIQRKT